MGAGVIPCPIIVQESEARSWGLGVVLLLVLGERGGGCRLLPSLPLGPAISFKKRYWQSLTHAEHCAFTYMVSSIPHKNPTGEILSLFYRFENRFSEP